MLNQTGSTGLSGYFFCLHTIVSLFNFGTQKSGGLVPILKNPINPVDPVKK
jgi:hypothetical protein